MPNFNARIGKMLFKNLGGVFYRVHYIDIPVQSAIRVINLPEY